MTLGSNPLEDLLSAFGGDFVELVGGGKNAEKDANDGDEDDDNVQGFRPLVQLRPLQLQVERAGEDAYQHESGRRRDDRWEGGDR